MIKIILYGSRGAMAQTLSSQIAYEEDMEIVAGISRKPESSKNPYPVYKNPYDFKGPVDLIIDFSHPSNLRQILGFALDKKIPLVIATTGLTDEDLKKIKKAGNYIPILYAPNTSLGIAALSSALKVISKYLGKDFDIEIIEKHHNKKSDSPSGTAYLLADIINNALENDRKLTFGRKGNNSRRETNEIGIHAIRGGSIPGEHSIIFAGPDEIIEIKHTALSKKIFALGAIKAGRFIVKNEKGLYTMDNIF